MGKIKFKEVRNYPHEIILGILTIAYIALFTSLTFLKYNNFYMGRFDLGNMAQTVWNTAHGNIFMLTDPNGTAEVSRLAFHADFILILLAPFYLLWEDPRMLLLIQTVVMSFGGIFVFLIAKEKLKNKNLSLVLAVCFFLSPAVAWVNLYDFHAVALASTFFLGAFYFILKKKWLLVILFLVLAGLTKEQVWAINVIFGLYLFFVSKQKLLGTVVAVSSAIIFYLLFWVAIPNAAGEGHFALQFYGDYGDSPQEIMKSILLNPIQTIETLLLPDRLRYIKELFMPLGYVSFVGFPLLIFAAPDLIINLLSGSPQMHQIYYQYSSTITPFIFIAAIYGAWYIKLKFSEIPYAFFSIFFLILTLVSAYNFGPLPFAKKPVDAMYKSPQPSRVVIDKYIKSLTDEQIISASNNLGSKLSHRNQIYTIPVGTKSANTIMFLITPGSNQKEKSLFEQMKNNPEFVLETHDGDFYVFKRAER